MKKLCLLLAISLFFFIPFQAQSAFYGVSEGVYKSSGGSFLLSNILSEINVDSGTVTQDFSTDPTNSGWVPMKDPFDNDDDCDFSNTTCKNEYDSANNRWRHYVSQSSQSGASYDPNVYLVNDTFINHTKSMKFTVRNNVAQSTLDSFTDHQWDFHFFVYHSESNTMSDTFYKIHNEKNITDGASPQFKLDYYTSASATTISQKPGNFSIEEVKIDYTYNDSAGTANIRVEPYDVNGNLQTNQVIDVDHDPPQQLEPGGKSVGVWLRTGANATQTTGDFTLENYWKYVQGVNL